MADLLESHLTGEELTVWKSLDTPAKIQAYLDQTPYSPQDLDRSPLSVMRDHLAHCLDGGLFAAAALRRRGTTMDMWNARESGVVPLSAPSATSAPTPRARARTHAARRAQTA